MSERTVIVQVWDADKGWQDYARETPEEVEAFHKQAHVEIFRAVADYGHGDELWNDAEHFEGK